MFIDIACNITCSRLARGAEKLIEECRTGGVLPVFVGLDAESSGRCLQLARVYDTCCYMGVHPNEVKDRSVAELTKQIDRLDFDDERVIGIGECGLDYFRSEKSNSQLEVFRHHVGLQAKCGLPMFYHCRAAFDDFIEIAAGHPGVVHSFDGTVEEMLKATSLGLYIGINGCSLKTEENIRVVEQLPLNYLVLETDSPYCQIRKNHASCRFAEADTGRFNTPLGVKKIAEVVAKIKKISIDELEKAAYENTLRLFPRLKASAEHWLSLTSK